MDEAKYIIFKMEEASAGVMNDGASNFCGIEESLTGAKILNADTHSKLKALILLA